MTAEAAQISGAVRTRSHIRMLSSNPSKGSGGEKLLPMTSVSAPLPRTRSPCHPFKGS